MSQQKARYFESLALRNSPASQQISEIIISQQTQQLVDSLTKGQPTHQIAINRQLAKQNRESSSIKQSLNSKTEMEQRNKGKSKGKGELHENEEDEEIDKCNLELNRIRKAREQLQKLLIGSSDIDIVKKMKVEKQILACLRQEQELKKEIQYQQTLKKNKIQRQQRNYTEKQLKKQLILERLDRIAEQKQSRVQLLSAKSMPAIPKYKIMERVFLMQDLKRQLDRKLQGKRLHQIRYKDYLKSLKSSKEASLSHNHPKQRVMTEAASQKKQTKKEQYHRKKQMIQILQEKRKKTKLKVDSQSSIKFEIMKDKTRNPQKYHFLKLKNLTDQQIYKEFQDYEIDFDSKSMGNQYLLQSKHNIKKNIPDSSILNSKPKSQRNGQIQNSKQQNGLKTQKKQSNSQHSACSSRKPRSFNNKAKAIDEATKHKEQIGKILRESESKSRVLQLLFHESSGNSRNIAELEKVLQQSNGYQQFLKIESCRDSEYLQFLKAKIVALGLQNL